MPAKVIQISLPEELVRRVDVAAQEEFASRSEFIRSALVERLKVVDEYRSRLQAAAVNTDVPTEEMIFDMLRLKDHQRKAAAWRREWFRDMRKRKS